MSDEPVAPGFTWVEKTQTVDAIDPMVTWLDENPGYQRDRDRDGAACRDAYNAAHRTMYHQRKEKP